MGLGSIMVQTWDIDVDERIDWSWALSGGGDCDRKLCNWSLADVFSVNKDMAHCIIQEMWHIVVI